MPRVVVLGSSGYDLTIRLPRLPKPGETLLGGELLTGPGGKGANAAVAARRAGADVTFLTAFGDDDFGNRIRAHDLAEGIDLTYARVVPRTANQVALIFVGDDGQNLIGVAPGASASLSPQDIDSLPAQVFDPQAVFLASLEVPLATVAKALRRAKAAGMTTVLNPAPADPAALSGDILRLVDILTPNQEETRVLTGSPTETLAEAARAAEVLRAKGVRIVIVTLGAEGCLVRSSDGATHIPPLTVAVVDTVGAGDAFNGALAVALAEGLTPEPASEWACAAGALAVTQAGAQGALPTRTQINELIARTRRGT